MNNAMPYEKYDGKFCKVIIRTNSGDKALKGIVKIFDSALLIKGEFQETTISYSEILRITTKELEDENAS